MKNIIIFILLFLMFNSCSHIADLKRTGEEISKEFLWNGVANVELWASVRVIPVVSNETKIELRGMDFIVNSYELEQTDDKLIVRHNNSGHLQENKIADLLLYAPHFNRFTFNAPCKFYSADTLHFNELNIIINGKGAYTSGYLLLKGNRLNMTIYGENNKINQTLSGNVDFANYFIEGATNIRAANLSTNRTAITHRSNGDCYVSASELLEVYVYSNGNVYYSGSPQLNVERRENSLMNASGQVYQFN